LCAAPARSDEISCYQKSVTPLFAPHFAKSTSFSDFELKVDEKKRKSGRFCQFSKTAPSFFPCAREAALTQLISL
jgi:hypothetical protein